MQNTQTAVQRGSKSGGGCVDFFLETNEEEQTEGTAVGMFSSRKMTRSQQ